MVSICQKQYLDGLGVIMQVSSALISVTQDVGTGYLQTYSRTRRT